jgi:hypothetical protein
MYMFFQKKGYLNNASNLYNSSYRYFFRMGMYTAFKRHKIEIYSYNIY